MTIRRHIRFLSTLLCIAACALLVSCSRDMPTDLRMPAIDILFPADGASFTWSADADPSTPGFQIDIQGLLTNFDSLDGAALSLAIDGVASSALATLKGEQFTFERVTLAGGMRKLAVAARTARQSATAEIAFTVPSGDSMGLPTVEISTPENGKVFTWSEDGDALQPKFQLDVTGALHNMPAGERLPSVTLQINGVLSDAAVQVSAVDEAGESEFSARNLTLEPGIHAIFVEAVQGDVRAFSQIHIAIPPAPGGEDPSYALSIESPASGAILDWGDDVLADVDGFQINVRGTLAGFGPNAEISLALNGLPLDAKPIRESSERYEFTDVSLPAGQQVLIVTAVETIEGARIQREALSAITVPALTPPEGLAVEIDLPQDGKSFVWSEDADPARENFQLDVRGRLQSREGESVTLTLQIDGIDVSAEATFPSQAAPEPGENSGAGGAPELLPEREFVFEGVTVDGGVHQIAVIAAQGSQRALDQINIAIPLPLPGVPSAEILSPSDGAALSLGGEERMAIDVSGNYANAQRLALYVDGQPHATIEPAVSQSGQFTFERVELRAGAHALQVQVSDGTYHGVSSVVTVHVADFGLDIHWPTASATLYADESGDLTVELIGEITGCHDCLGAPSVALQIDAGAPEEVALGADRAFRHTVRIAQPGDRASLLIRARQALQDTEASGTSPTFESEERLELTILHEKPSFEIAITQPADGSALTWRDNTDLSGGKFQISVEASIDGLSLGEAAFKLYVDGVLTKTDVSQDCALTTEGQAITALTCRNVALSAGPHLISLTATTKAEGKALETYAFVTAPDISEPSQTAALIISAPADGTVMNWKGDLSFASGFQTDISGRFTGFGSGVEFSLLIDGVASDATAAVGNGTYAFRGVTLASGVRSLKVLAKEMIGGDLKAASDVIVVTVPPAQEISIEAERVTERLTRVTGTLDNFSEDAAFSLDVYVDGAFTTAITPEAAEISQGTFSFEVSDDDLSIDPDAACHHLTFTLIGVEGQNETSATTTQEIGECSLQKPRALVITSPRSGSTLQVANTDGLNLSVFGVLLGYDRDTLPPRIALGSDGLCSADLTTQTFHCEGDFVVGDHDLVARDELNDISSDKVAISIRNSTGCPVALSLESAPVGEDGVLEFNRQTPGIRLANGQDGTTASYTFFGSVPVECAGGTVTVLKKLSGGSYAVEARTTNILADGTFAYRATLNDAETDAELAFSASKNYFATAAGAQLTYTADFTVPTLVAAPGDTFVVGATTASAILHEGDLREGLRATVIAAEGDGVRGEFNLTFTAQGLSQDAASADTLTIAYDGSTAPLINEDILQTAEGSTEAFTKRVALPEGDWTLSLTLTDAVGNASTASFPVHVDLGCGVRLASPLPNSAIAITPVAGESLTPLVLSGTSTCAQTAYGIRIGAGQESALQTCQPSGEDGAFTCAVSLAPSTGATEVSLIAPNGAEQSVRVFQISSNHTIDVEAPRLKDGGFVIVSPQNRHCTTARDGEGSCDDGYVVDLSPEDESIGAFALRLAVAMDAQYAPYDELSCRYLIGGQELEAQTCSIAENGVIDDEVSLPQGTRGDFQIEITSGHSESGATETISFAMGVTVASKRLNAPTFRLPTDEIVADCVSGGTVTCIQDRHQGILDVWLDAPAPGIARTRGFVTGTAVSIASASDNTEAFDAATFEDGALMTWFSAVAQADSTHERQRLTVTPMNLIHLGAQDQDAHGNYSDVALVKSIDMFWNVFRRTFAAENAASELGINAESGMLFGQLAAVGDFNGDGVDDLAVTLGNADTKGTMIIYYGSRTTGLSSDNRQVIEGSAHYMTSIAAADLNHDGYDDIVVIYFDLTSYSYPSQIYFGTPNGISSETHSIDIQYSSVFGHKTGFLNVKTIADIDGDGYSDLAFSESLEGIYLPNDPNPNANVFIVPTGAELMARLNGQAITLADISLYTIEGETDDSLGMGLGSASWNILAVSETHGVGLAIGAPGNQKAYYFRHADLKAACLTASGGCRAASAASQIFDVADRPNQEFGKAMAVLDQNNDGVADIFFGLPSLLSGSQNPQNDVLASLGTDGADGITFSAPLQFNSETMTKGFFGTNLLPANLLGDGYEALVVGGASTVDDRLHIFWNSAASGLKPQYGSIIEGPATFGFSLETGDFNSDGQLDLFVGAPSCSSCKGSGDKNGEFYVYY